MHLIVICSLQMWLYISDRLQLNILKRAALEVYLSQIVLIIYYEDNWSYYVNLSFESFFHLGEWIKLMNVEYLCKLRI